MTQHDDTTVFATMQYDTINCTTLWTLRDQLCSESAVGLPLIHDDDDGIVTATGKPPF